MIKCGVIEEIGRRFYLFKSAARFKRGEMVAKNEEVLLRRAELAGANGATEDDDGEEEAEEGHIAMVDESVQLPSSANTQALFYHCTFSLYLYLPLAV